MKKQTLYIILGVVIVVIVLYFAFFYKQTPSASAPTANADVLINGNALLGDYLIASNGMALYTFANDTTSQSTCLDQCALKWPPYITSSIPVPSEDLSGTIGASARDDGSLQITYEGKPLYFWSGDRMIGDTTGNGVNGLWSVARP